MHAHIDNPVDYLNKDNGDNDVNITPIENIVEYVETIIKPNVEPHVKAFCESSCKPRIEPNT